jgi:hypothetical protein
MTLPLLTQKTRSGHWGWDEHRYFGHRVFEELAGKQSLTAIVALSVLRRPLPAEDVAVLDDMAGAVTLADPRIWPLKLTRLVASYGAAIPAVAAGLLMEEGARIGPSTGVGAAEVLVQFHERIGDRVDDPAHVRAVVAEYLAEHSFVWGFGTPYRSRDERFIAFRECLRRRGRDQRPYFRTMEAVADVIRAERNAEPNIGAAVAAMSLDMGFLPSEVGMLSAVMMQHMFFGHAVEEAAAPSALLSKLPDEYVRYRGRKPRTSPRASAAEGRTDVPFV